MEWLNYHHLYYFWTTAREGNLRRASRKLRLAPSTVSAQIKSLEERLEQPLFVRAGRSLQLSEAGQVVLEYADEIFSLGKELVDAVPSGAARRRPLRLRVGVANILPKLVAYRLLAPALEIDALTVQLICQEATAEELVAELAIHHLDLVLADAPVGLARDVHAKSQLLGTCETTLFATPKLASQLRGDFPRFLDGAPLLLPGRRTTLRPLLEDWMERNAIEPRVVAEFNDSALMKAFGQAGAGVFAAPSLVQAEICEQYEVAPLGTADGVLERFYALTMPSRHANPALRAVLDTASESMRPA